jgi:hypothetical protein
MAQSREKRKQRPRTRSPEPSHSPVAERGRTNTRRIVLALILVVGLAGILIVSSPGGGDEPEGRAPIG